MEPATVANKTILVTGGAGFIGQHLVAALVDDNEVRVLDNGSTGKPEKLPATVEYYAGDIRDREAVGRAVDDVDVVFHLAAVVSVEESVDRPVETHDVNLSGTLTVLEAARRVDARVVFASSAAVYGRPQTVPVGETDRTDPLSPYGLQKLAAEKYVRLYADLYDLETVALRYFNVYGPGQMSGAYAGVITAFRDRIRNDEPLTIHGDGSQTRDFVHVSDVVQANLKAASAATVGEAYNIGTGQSVTIRELAETMCSAAESDLTIERDSPREGDMPLSEADITKARTQLNYEPQVELSDGLADLLG